MFLTSESLIKRRAIATVMVTTITISENMRRKLAKLKQQKGASSFDELLAEIADRELGAPKSLFGKAKGLVNNFEREHRERE